MQAPVPDPDSRRSGLTAFSKKPFRVIALVATTLVALVVTAPARAQEAPVVPIDAATETPAAEQPPGPPPSDPGPTNSPQDAAVTEVPRDSGSPPGNSPPANTGGGDTASAGAGSGSGPSSEGTGGGDGSSNGSQSQRQPAHTGSDGRVSPATPSPTSPPAADAGDATQQAAPPASDGGPDAWLGQDTFVVDETGGGDRPTGAPAALRAPFGGLYALRAVSRASRIEAKARRAHDVAKLSALGGGTGSGPGLPDHNPFFNLLSGSGGSAAGLALASILAVLGAAFVLPRHRSTIFRLPTVTWRPSAYVPPIELPG